MTGLRSMLSNHSHHLVQDSVPPSNDQSGRVGIPGDFSVPAVRVVEVAGLGNGIGWRQGRGVRGLFPDVFEDLRDLKLIGMKAMVRIGSLSFSS